MNDYFNFDDLKSKFCFETSKLLEVCDREHNLGYRAVLTPIFCGDSCPNAETGLIKYKIKHK